MEIVAQVKVCRKCGQEKPEEGFPHNRRVCRACIAEDNKRRYAENPAKYRQAAKESTERHKERKRAYDTSEKRHEQKRRYRERLRAEKGLPPPRRYKSGESRCSHSVLGAWASHQNDIWATNTAHKRARMAGCLGTFLVEEWNWVRLKYDGRCLRCGTTKGITIDHVIPLASGGYNSVENLQPLCMRCNASKGNTIVDYRPKD